MHQKPMGLIEFQGKFATEKARQQHLFQLRWPDGYRCRRCGHTAASFHTTRHLYQCKSCKYQVSLSAGNIFHKTRTPLEEVVLDDLSDGTSEERYLHSLA